MVKPISVSNPETFTKLWANESLRVFYDRLINNQDKEWFTHLLIELMQRNFKMNFDHNQLFV